MPFQYLNLINQAKNQQHPFHVLGESRLPVFIAAFVGSLAISVIIKLQNVSKLSQFLIIGEELIQPFFTLPICLLSQEIPNEATDSRILQFLALILLTLWA
jgi:hypothetical protein